MARADVDLSELDALVDHRDGQCKLGQLFKQLSNEDRAKLVVALPLKRADGEFKYSHRAIQQWFATRGMRIATETIRLHRVGGCRCE
jgi:hypothetical protein